MNLGHQVETVEISDASLDGISGGLAVGGSGGLFLETSIGDVCGDVVVAGTESDLSLGTSLNAATR
ncbi:hypothetical protein ABZ354_10410 [Streptomyces sp. NPDC005925]|uniref:hypothetical protein n=1 Tax=Streptomyces sp. NPDC005925 TaxID=3157172 RepID=UPI0033C01EE9